MNDKKVLLIILIFIIGAAFSAGIKIRPGTILLQEAPVGETYDFESRRGQNITIGPVEKNITYTISAEPAGEGGSQATGYYDFPDASWFTLDLDTISIEAGFEGDIGMWMDIPAEDGLYNHHWLLGIPISPVPVEGKGTQIQVGAYLLFRIETESLDGVIPACAKDEIVTVPSRPRFVDVLPGQENTLVVQLFHGKASSGLYEVSRLDPESPVAQLTILGTPGFPRLANPDWITYPEEIVIPGEEEGGSPFPITLKIPAGAQIRRFEEIIMIKNDKTRPAFIRILVNTKQG